MTTATIDPSEAAFFGKLAADWWDPKGSSAMLHRLNPARLSYLRARIDEAWDLDPRERHPLDGRRALDVGCGAGLLSEPLARLGAAVTGLDAAPENIAAARHHAEGQGLAIDYRAGGIESSGRASVSIWSCRWRWSSMSPIRPPSSPGWRGALAEDGAADPVHAQPHAACRSWR